ncbi:uncharacterized protein E0L32_011134 [Thyridium curvatum]|uniref:14-3-3 protein n=1 Tax=Thyridium curvatum TaxID=1093900 RepID=A0A507ARU4_9PEZI|nr:uncharacterized protein E0L32_011134 [Thyridium curvatum]TPX06910.1 hypothetical protein E0L32_011134 [Thyridium curvatum]
MLFKILGLSINLAAPLVTARKQRRLDPSSNPQYLELYFHILWLSREGLVMLEQYVLPMVGNYVELKVLAFKLRASFYHIFVLFHNHPQVSNVGISTPDATDSSADPATRTVEKGKGIARDDISISATPPIYVAQTKDGGPVGPPPGFGPSSTGNFLLPAIDFLPAAHQYFKEALALADELLWGSHSLRLSVKTEYAAFLYDCVHDAEGSRKLAQDTIAEVYQATEGIDNDMFSDACELVTVLGKMMKRGLGASGSGTKAPGQQQDGAGPAAPPSTTGPTTAAGMPEFI